MRGGDDEVGGSEERDCYRFSGQRWAFWSLEAGTDARKLLATGQLTGTAALATPTLDRRVLGRRTLLIAEVRRALREDEETEGLWPAPLQDRGWCARRRSSGALRELHARVKERPRFRSGPALERSTGRR